MGDQIEWFNYTIGYNELLILCTWLIQLIHWHHCKHGCQSQITSAKLIFMMGSWCRNAFLIMGPLWEELTSPGMHFHAFIELITENDENWLIKSFATQRANNVETVHQYCFTIIVLLQPCVSDKQVYCLILLYISGVTVYSRWLTMLSNRTTQYKWSHSPPCILQTMKLYYQSNLAVTQSWPCQTSLD